MPALNTGLISARPDRRVVQGTGSRQPTTNITVTMSAVHVQRDRRHPPRRTRGRRSSKSPRMTMRTDPTRNGMAELRPSLVAVRCRRRAQEEAPLLLCLRRHPGPRSRPSPWLPALTGWRLPQPAVAAVGIGGSRPARIFSWTSGSSARSCRGGSSPGPSPRCRRCTEKTVTARIWVSPKLYSSVRSGEHRCHRCRGGEVASATQDCTTLTVMGRDGSISLRYDTS